MTRIDEKLGANTLDPQVTYTQLLSWSVKIELAQAYHTDAAKLLASVKSAIDEILDGARAKGRI